ncbi:hypothetical protein [Hominiventricola filiformis]|uniref:Uncharacterized protein n=1 Tax=Hominiventricola filiformis TaxID=2885352 RepID=A0AAE3D8W5_9FIRM|nr:hypothetical protein [Hominiventricola filiformis]MCC2125103.1 hypothetical protein [Hominiventricola filiformis]
MKKKTTQTKMEKRFFLLIAILALIAIGVVAYGVGSTLTGGNHVKNTDSGTEEAADETSDSGKNDPLAIHSIIIGDTEASVLHDTTDGADDYIIKAALPVDFSFEKTTLNVELADGAVVSDKSNCLINDLGGRPVVDLTVEKANLIIESEGNSRTYFFMLDVK